MKVAFARYLALVALLGTMLAGCQSGITPSATQDVGYEIFARDGISRGVIHIVSADDSQVEWDAWLDWHEGGQSARSVFHGLIKLDKSGVISEATITRHPDETLRITVLADRLHCELSQGGKSPRIFEIATNGAALFIPPLPFSSQAQSILCFDPFSWDYATVMASPESIESRALYAEGKKAGEIKSGGDGIDAMELPLTAFASSKKIEFDAESVPAAAIIPPMLSVQDLERLTSLEVDFDLSMPSSTGWKWADAGDIVYTANTCKGEWVFSNKVSSAKSAEKAHSSEETEWGVIPAHLATVTGTQPNPKPAAIPSSPLSALMRGMGDDRSRAWLAASLARQQGWQARIAGGIVLRPGRNYAPVMTQWAEILRDGVTEITDADVAAGFHLRLWTAPQPLAGISGKVAIKAVQVATPSPWHIVPPALDNRTWQWELSRDGALLGRMNLNWEVNLTSSRPTMALSYHGDSMNLSLSGNVALEVDAGGLVWGYLSPELAKSPWLLLALCKGWLLCPAGNGTIAGLSLYFVSRDENGWLPPLLWADGQPAEVREAGEGTYSDGRELRRVHRYRVDPPGLLVSVAEGGELMEVKGEFGTWHRVNLNPQRLSTQH